MKKITFFLLLLSCCYITASNAQPTAMGPGDVVIIGFNSNVVAASPNRKNFQFLLLKDATDGTVIRFTGTPFASTSAANAANNALLQGSLGVTYWKNNTGSTLTAGTIITMTTILTAPIGVTASVGTAGNLPGSCGCTGSQGNVINWNSTAGKILIYYGDDGTSGSTSVDYTGAPTTQTAVTFKGAAIEFIAWQGGSASYTNFGTMSPVQASGGNSSYTYLPNDIAYHSFIGGSASCGYFNGNRTGYATVAALRNAILDPSNWFTKTGTVNTVQYPTGSFTIPGINVAPSFTGGSSLTLCQNASATSINSLLQITDVDASQTETFSVTGNPSHGSIAIGSTVGSGINVSPTGWSYTPTAGYSGTDQFAIQVSDGTATASTTITVAIKAATSSGTTHTACDNYTWNGINYTVSGTYTKTGLTNAAGCDSTATLNLTINHSSSSTANLSILDNQLPYIWNGLTFTAAGTQTAHLTNAVSCDSAATLNLTVTTSCSPTSSTTTHTACYNYNWNGVNYATSGTYTKTGLTNAAGCDSTATLVLTINISSLSTTSHTACSNYTWNGVSYTTSGTYTKTGLTNAAGCDSMAVLNLTINQPTSSTTNASVCSNQLPYTWNGLNFTAAGTQTKTGLTNAAGCDSTATLVLSVSTSSVPAVSVATASNSVCAGTVVIFTATPTNGGTSPTYQWKVNGNNVGSNSNTYSSATLNNNDSVWCLLTSNSACATSSTATSNKIKMTIKANPGIGTSFTLKTVLCSISATTNANNTNTLGGGIWSSDNTGVVTVTTNAGASGVVTATGAGTATLTYTKTGTNGCSVSAACIITVDPLSTPVITAPASMCKSSSTTLTATPGGGTWSSSTVAISINASTGLAVASNSGTAIVNYAISNANGCTATGSKTFPVNTIPTAPNITYAAGAANPQTGAVPATAFCNNRTFTLLGSPAGGSWSTTNSAVVTVTSGGVVQTVGLGSGSVVYTVTNAGGCSNSKSIVGAVVGCTPRGINTNAIVSNDSKFILYPNPAISFFSLNIHSLIGSGSIVITDLYGKQVKQQSLSIGTNIMDVSCLAKGMYMVSVITSDGKTTEKLIIE